MLHLGDMGESSELEFMKIDLAELGFSPFLPCRTWRSFLLTLFTRELSIIAYTHGDKHPLLCGSKHSLSLDFVVGMATFVFLN